jgi:3-deoxy-D-manno-octulosonic-acid transferase
MIERYKVLKVLLFIYRATSTILSPLLKVALHYRKHLKKEDSTRLKERYGIASTARPSGKLIWIHGASVGEAVSILPLAHKLRLELPSHTLLITTGTVTAATIMAKRLPEGCIHQYVPLDAPHWTNRFLNHWKPDTAIFVESELWPNLIFTCHQRKIPLILLNARISDRSFARWSRFPKLSKAILSCFSSCLAQSDKVEEKLNFLGANNVCTITNLKFAVAPLTYSQDELEQLSHLLADRSIWLAASTHPGEESIIATAHVEIQKQIPNVLTIIIPRHPHRGNDIAKDLTALGLHVSSRSKGEVPSNTTDVYLSDTLGELGLFYALSPIVFLGGTLVPVGGHNPIEPAHLNCALLWGPNLRNFIEICKTFKPAAIQISDKEELSKQVIDLLKNPELCQSMAKKAKEIVKNQSEVINEIFNKINLYC